MRSRVARRLRGIKAPLRHLLAVAMTAVGVAHFIAPAPFVSIVPPWLPSPRLLVYISGVAEVLGGVGLWIPKTRRAAAWGLVALYVAVFPANIHMALNNVPMGDLPPNPLAAWLRLPFQFLFIAWAWWYTSED